MENQSTLRWNWPSRYQIVSQAPRSRSVSWCAANGNPRWLSFCRASDEFDSRRLVGGGTLMATNLVLERYPTKQWNAAKSEMKGVLVEAARMPRLLTYKQGSLENHGNTAR